MKRPFSSLAGLLAILALLAGVWVHGHAQARPRMHELAALVLCADGQEVTLLVDALGRPVAPPDCAPEFCADCLLVSPLAVGGEAAALAALAFTTNATLLPDRIAPADPAHAVFQPRAPPPSI